jgi:hypothetical protein
MSLAIRNDARPITTDRYQAPNAFDLPAQMPAPATVARAPESQQSMVAQTVSDETFVREHRRFLADLDNEASRFEFDPVDFVQSTINRIGSGTGLFETQLSPHQRVAPLRQAYVEAIDRFEAGDPQVSRSTLTELRAALDSAITGIQRGDAQRRELLAGFGAGTAEFFRSTSVGLAAGVGSAIGGPATGALAGGLQSVGSLMAMVASAEAQEVPLDQLDLPQRLVDDVANVFSTLAGPALLTFMGLPGAPTANTMRAIAAHMGRQGMIDAGLDGLTTTVSEAVINGQEIPEALRAGAVAGAWSFVLSGAVSGPLGAIDARQQTALANTLRQMNANEVTQWSGALDARTASSLREQQPIVYRALEEKLGADRMNGLVGAAQGRPHSSASPNPETPAAVTEPAGNTRTAVADPPGGTPSNRAMAEGTTRAEPATGRAPDNQATLARNRQALEESLGTDQVSQTVQPDENAAVTAARRLNDEVRTRNDNMASAGIPDRVLDVTIPVRGTVDGEAVDFNLRGAPLALENEVRRLQDSGVIPADFDVGAAAAQAGAPWNTIRQADLDLRANQLEVQNGTTLFDTTVNVEVDEGSALQRVRDINANSSGDAPVALFIPLESRIAGSEGAGGTGRAATFFVQTPDRVRDFFDTMVDQGRFTIPEGQSRDSAFQDLLERSGVGGSFAGRLSAAQDTGYRARLPQIGGQQPQLVVGEEAYTEFRSRAREANAGARDAVASGDGSRMDSLALVVPGPGPRGAFAENLTRGETASLLNAMQDSGLIRDGVSMNDIIAANNLQDFVGIEGGQVVALDPRRTLTGTPDGPALPPAANDSSPGASAEGGGRQPPNGPPPPAAPSPADPDEPGGPLGPVGNVTDNSRTLDNISRAPYRDVAAYINDPDTELSELPEPLLAAFERRLRDGLDDADIDGATRTSLEQAMQRLRGDGTAGQPGGAATGQQSALPGNPIFDMLAPGQSTTDALDMPETTPRPDADISTRASNAPETVETGSTAASPGASAAGSVRSIADIAGRLRASPPLEPSEASELIALALGARPQNADSQRLLEVGLAKIGYAPLVNDLPSAQRAVQRLLNVSDADALVAELSGSDGLARLMRQFPEIGEAILTRPKTIEALGKHPEALAAVENILRDLDAQDPLNIRIPDLPAPPQSNLSAEQIRISQAAAQAMPAEDYLRRQPGFDPEWRNDPSRISEYLDTLYARAEAATPEFTSYLNDLAETTNGTAQIRPEPKSRKRALDKIDKYEGDASRLTDLMAGRIVFERVDDVYDALSALVASENIRVVNFEDRILTPQPSGYRDITMNIELSNGHIAELRLELGTLTEYSNNIEHALYEVYRDLKAYAKSMKMEPTKSAQFIMNSIRNLTIPSYNRLFQEASDLPQTGSEGRP